MGTEVYRRLQLMLADSPHPDSVVVLLDRLLDVATEEVRARLLGDTNLLYYACLIFGQSRWLSETVIRNPDILQKLGQRGELDRALSREEFREEFGRHGSADENLSVSLAKFRKAAYVRVLLRDLLGIARIAEITEEISTLSDVLIEEALRAANSELSSLYGTPSQRDGAGQPRAVRSAIVALGKLGGCELNYSSDVDLMFLYECGGKLEESSLTYREYFIRLAERTTSLLSQPTTEGQVLRIDLRLRPEGSGGDLAVSLQRAIHYYSGIAQDWELQAMIKARHTAGDVSLTREFLRAIEPAVYRPNINFAAVKTALQARERIDRRNRTTVRKGRTSPVINVKLDRGGIRDIEFLVQCLQRVYGGEEAWLRSRGTLSALQKLHDKEHIGGKDFHTLTKSYEFLRNVEHRLQLRQGQQVHQLPESEVELEMLAKSLPVSAGGVRSAAELLEEVNRQMAEVANIYLRVVYVDRDGHRLEQESGPRPGVEAPSSAEDSYSQAMRRLAAEAPQVMAELSRAKLSQHARRNLGRFLNSAATSPERFATVVRSPRPVARALRIFECSEFLTDLLVYDPAGIEVLNAPTVADRPISKPRDMGAAQKLLRQQYRNAVLNVNSRDLFDRCNIWEILSENTRIADEALRFALAVSGETVGFAVMALGRLGSCEFDIMSDADLLFVADEFADSQLCRRAAERILESLSAYTLDGTVFLVDTRLRPQGSQGELVTSPKRLASYFTKEAKAWEGLTYLRLRYIAGAREVAEQAIQAVAVGIVRMARNIFFSDELGQMRRRLADSDVDNNLKTGPGGAYDIDYLVGLLQAKHGIWAHGNLSERVHAVQAAGLLEPEDARRLAENAEFLRNFEHVVRLVTGQCAKWMPKSEHARAKVMELAGPRERDVRSLEGRLKDVMGSTRAIYRKYLFD